MWYFIFAAVSVSLVIINKAVMKTFPFPGSLLVFQETILLLCPEIIRNLTRPLTPFFQNGLTIVLNLLGAALGFFEMKPWRIEHLAQFGVQACLMALTLTLNLVGLPRNAVATLLVFKSLQVQHSCIALLLCSHPDILFFHSQGDPHSGTGNDTWDPKFHS